MMRPVALVLCAMACDAGFTPPGVTPPELQPPGAVAPGQPTPVDCTALLQQFGQCLSQSDYDAVHMDAANMHSTAGPCVNCHDGAQGIPFVTSTFAADRHLPNLGFLAACANGQLSLSTSYNDVGSGAPAFAQHPRFDGTDIESQLQPLFDATLARLTSGACAPGSSR